ncbi:MAG: Translation initiation factor IF-3 [Candidatus Anoxychlamydiales bacterium]|nr:Translation initiation factor IF-3 [Candidatus Anoxychlamydiales bacterium]
MRINRQIRADKVRVINSDGSQAGVMSLSEALNLAADKDLDLVEISSNAKPPVCKIIDFGKYKYQQLKREKEGKKSQHQVKLKEIKFKPNIDNHDFLTKEKHAKEFILKGYKVKVTLSFRGRQMLHTEQGKKIIQRLIDDLQDIAQIESPLKLMGRTIVTVLAPIGKKYKGASSE